MANANVNTTAADRDIDATRSVEDWFNSFTKEALILRCNMYNLTATGLKQVLSERLYNYFHPPQSSDTDSALENGDGNGAEDNIEDNPAGNDGGDVLDVLDYGSDLENPDDHTWLPNGNDGNVPPQDPPRSQETEPTSKQSRPTGKQRAPRDPADDETPGPSNQQQQDAIEISATNARVDSLMSEVRALRTQLATAEEAAQRRRLPGGNNNNNNNNNNDIRATTSRTARDSSRKRTRQSNRAPSTVPTKKPRTNQPSSTTTTQPPPNPANFPNLGLSFDPTNYPPQNHQFQGTVDPSQQPTQQAPPSTQDNPPTWQHQWQQQGWAQPQQQISSHYWDANTNSWQAIPVQQPQPAVHQGFQGMYDNNYYTGYTYPGVDDTSPYLPPPVETTILKKISKREYVNFKLLLPNNQATDTNLEESIPITIGRSNVLKLNKKDGKKEKIDSFRRWCTAWNVFMAAHLHYFPGEHFLLSSYFEIMVGFFGMHKVKACLSYDKAFRLGLAAQLSLPPPSSLH